MPLRAEMWIKMFWAFGLILALTLAPFVIVKLVIHKTARELVGPYSAFVVLQMIFLTVAMGLRKWEDHGPSPKLLALCWSLSVAIFFAAIDGGLFYSGIHLHLIDPKDTLGYFVFGLAASVFSVFFIMYYKVLPLIIARAGTDHP